MNLIRTAISRQLSYQPPPQCLFVPLSPFSSLTSHSLPSSQYSPSSSPRPTQIPYQPKLLNFVHLFGTIHTPLQTHTTPDGIHMAATFIAPKDASFIANSSTSLLIPLLFQADLAHTVASHVNQNDSVHVTGKLSMNPLPFVLSEYQGKFHLIGNDINFVRGLDMRGPYPIQENVENNVVKEQAGNRESSVEEWEEFVSNINQWSVITSQDKVIKGAVEGFERRVDGKRLDLDSSTPLWVYKKLNELNSEKEIEPLNTKKKSATNVGGTTKRWRNYF